MRCWNCSSDTAIAADSIGFGATCPQCFAYLHVCRACRFCNGNGAAPCDHPHAEYVGDKVHRNFCEHFFILSRLTEPSDHDREEIEAQATRSKKRKTETLRRFDDLFA